MKYLSVKVAAKKMDLSEDKVRTLCREGKLEGAKKNGNLWFIPDTTVESYQSPPPKPYKSSQREKTSSTNETHKTSQSEKTSSSPSAKPNTPKFKDNDLLKGLLIELLVLLVFVAMTIGGIFMLLDSSSIFGALLIILGAGGVYLMVKALREQKNHIKETISSQKSQNKKSSLKKKMIQLAVITVVSTAIILAGGLCFYGANDASYLNKKADELLATPVSAAIFDNMAEFDEYYNQKSSFTKLFFTRKSEIEALKLQADELVMERAKEISKSINSLKPLKKIKSAEQYYAIKENISKLDLSENDKFERKVREKVDNYDKLSDYIDNFNQLCDTYTISAHCSSCGGRGRYSCSTCGGSGKCLVTWYEHGDWGETSYTSYTCTSCNGRGKYSCSSCGGSGTREYLQFEN